MPTGEVAPPALACIGQSPSGRFFGTWIAIWYRPTDPAESAAPNTVAGTLLMVTVGAVAVTYAWSEGTATPGGAAGLVGPNPVPHNSSTSPGLAAAVVTPEKLPGLAAKL